MSVAVKKQAIPRKPLLWYAAALLFSVPPMFGNLAWWVPVTFLVVLIAKFRMEQRGIRLRSIPWKLAAAAAMLGAVHLQYHVFTGLEPGLSISILLIAIKILEAHTARDFHILALLGWFLGLAGLFVSQGIGAGLYATLTFWLILTAVAQFHGGASQGGIIAPLRSSFRLMLAAVPLIAVMFFLFPRGSGPFRFELNHAMLNRTGMSDQLSPGSVASLALSNEVAFRVEFPDGNVPRSSNLYWRGAMLMKDEGLAWSPIRETLGPSRTEDIKGVPVHQIIVVQPNNGQWLFALDWPAKPASRDMVLQAGYILHSTKHLYSPRKYEINSFPYNRQTRLRSLERRACLQLPEVIPARASKLVQSWTADGAPPRTIVARALDFFRKENFTYSISPGPYGDDGLDDFLFNRRVGFCEHYAAAFGTLMRMAGIPTRVVVGYQGGQFNSLGDYLVVHQSDAHAWCEVWFADTGWERTDPTAAVAPGRLDMGLAGYMDMSAASHTGAGAIGDLQASGVWGNQPIFRKLQLAWDTISYEWDAHVLNFDEETQQTFFVNLGMVDTRALRLLGWLTLAVIFLLCLQSIWLWWRARVSGDPAKALYDRFARRVAVLGVEREPWEGPMHFAARASGQLPSHAPEIVRITRIYTTLRYSQPEDQAAETAATRELKQEIKAFCSQSDSH